VRHLLDTASDHGHLCVRHRAIVSPWRNGMHWAAP
jgi:hypothetical protein